MLIFGEKTGFNIPVLTDKELRLAAINAQFLFITILLFINTKSCFPSKSMSAILNDVKEVLFRLVNLFRKLIILNPKQLAEFEKEVNKNVEKNKEENLKIEPDAY